jgi:Uma2 family endonuclease
MASSPVHRFTEEEYLEIERASEYKSEFIDGEIFAMAGGIDNHLRLQSNFQGELFIRLRGGPCEVVGSDLRVKIPAAKIHTYPDVSVVCGRPENLLSPTVIVEVLSRSTESYDRGKKSQAYRTLESLKEYILVDQYVVLVECYSRRDDNTWTSHVYTKLDEELRIDSIGVSIPISGLYDGVQLINYR